jgi:7-carboxy-7-deazaguanine synthase
VPAERYRSFALNRDFPPPPTLVVAGVVGPTMHPQGPSAGRRCSVIQMGGCNLSCTWCDSAFTWNTARYDLSREVGYWPITEIAEQALACRPSMVVISGGEPLQQQNSEAWAQLLDLLAATEIGVETNGTFAPIEATLTRVHWVTVSPKLAHSGDPSWARINGEVLVDWGHRARDFNIDFSFTVRDVSDVATVSTMAAIHGLPLERIWIIPEGTTPTISLNRLQEVSDAALNAGLNLSARLNAQVTR